MVTVFEFTPPMEIETGATELATTPAGTSAFTWYSPTNPGASPENSTVAAAPPIVTVGIVVVQASGPSGAGAPVAR